MIDNGKAIDYVRYADFPEKTPSQDRIVNVEIMTSQGDNPSPFKKGEYRSPDLSLAGTDILKRRKSNAWFDASAPLSCR